jgi:outer membrane protein assembly factor BamB
MAHDVFIAYSRRDAEAASAVRAYLSAQGLGCFQDSARIRGSETWVREVIDALDVCHAVVVLISDASAASEHVAREVSEAGGAHKTFIPVMLNEGTVLSAEMRYYLGRLHYISAVSSLDAALPAISDAAWRAVDRGRHRDAYEAEEKVRRRATYDLTADLGQDDLQLFVGEDATSVARIEAERYVIAAKPGKDHPAHLLRGVPLLSDCVFEACLTKLDGAENAWFGLRLGQERGGDYYKFWLSGNGAVRVERRWKGRHSDLAHLHNVRQVKTGDGENVLKVVCADDSLHVFVNGLHVTTRNQVTRVAGRPGFVVGQGARVAFSDLRVTGVSLPALLDAAIGHWLKLEMREAKRVLRYIAQYAPTLKHPGHPSDVANLLAEAQPDRQETCLVVIGSSMLGQLNDGPVAAKLCEEIDRRGKGHEFRWARVVTDQAILGEPRYRECPLIMIGGGETNRLTAQLAAGLPHDPCSGDRVHIQHDLERGGREVALWGAGAVETEDAVKRFISAGLLGRFLAAIWKTARPPEVPAAGDQAREEEEPVRPSEEPSAPPMIRRLLSRLSGGARVVSKVAAWAVALAGLTFIGLLIWAYLVSRPALPVPTGARAAPTIPAESEPAWPMLLFGSERRGQHPYGTATEGHVQWEFQTGGSLWSSPAVGADGTVYVQASDGFLYALTTHGQLRWKLATGRGVAGNVSGYSSPAIASDGTVYVGSSDTYVYAVTPEGKLKWRVKTGWCVLSSPAIGPDGTVYVGSEDRSVYAIAPDGQVKWQWKGASGIVWSPALAADGTVYVGSSDGRLYAVSAIGTLRWSYQTGATVWACPVLGLDGTIYVGSDDTHFYALSPEGGLKWKFRAKGAIGRPAAVSQAGTIYVGATSQGLLAFNPDGSVKWSFPQPVGAPDAPVVGPDGTIYVGFAWGHNRFYALDRNGRPRWELAVTADWNTPAVGRDGTIYATCQQGRVYAIR